MREGETNNLNYLIDPACPDPRGYLAAKVLEDGLIVCVVPLTFGRARLTIGRDWTSWSDGY